MEISRPGLKGIVDNMSEKLDHAQRSRDIGAVLLIARVLACAAHQLTLNDGDDVAIKASAEALLQAQAELMRHEEHR
jgi:hypothetical protein